MLICLPKLLYSKPLILTSPLTVQLRPLYGELRIVFLNFSSLSTYLSQKYEDNNGTYGRCITAYQDTLKGGRFVQGKSVWIDSHGVDLLCSLLQPHMKVLEFGSGGSTSLFSQFVMHWDSVEHNKMWADKVSKETVKI